jgi:DnaD/phage-associated family protein
MTTGKEAAPMSDPVFLPGNILSLSAGAAERLISSGSGDAALLYLYLLKAGGRYDPAAATRALRWDSQRTAGAFSLLAGLGLAQAPAPSSAPAPAPQPPEYTASDINRELENQASPFPILVQEVQRRLGKVLSTNDLKSLYTIYDFSGLPPEVILLVVNWTIEEFQRKYGPSRLPRLPQIQQEAMRWKERGVDTVESAEAHMRRLAQLRDRSVQILALLDIRDHKPIKQEKEYIARWLDMGFPDEVIRLAYEKTIMQTQKLSWKYLDSILTDWHQKGLHSVKEISARDSVRPRRPRPGAGATAPQPAAPGEADRRAREDMERLRAYLKQQEKEGT